MIIAPTALDLSRDELETALRRWGSHGSPSARAAVDLLIEHDFWTTCSSFINLAVVYYPRVKEAAIRWSDAREMLEAGAFHASTSRSERAILDFAVALGEDRFYWSGMGDAHHEMLRRTVHTATRGK